MNTSCICNDNLSCSTCLTEIPEELEETITLARTCPFVIALVSTICILATVVGATTSILIVISCSSFNEISTYSNAFVASLAVRDFVFLGLVVPIFMINFIDGKYPFDTMVCRFQLMVTFPLGLGSVMELMNIAINRFVKLCCPPYAYPLIYSKKMTSLLLGVSWGLGFILGIPPALLDGMLEEETGMCYIKKSPMKATIATLTLVSTTTVTSFCYSQIMRMIWKSKRNLKRHNEGPAKQRKLKRITTKCIRDLLVYTIYIFLLLPYLLVNGFGLSTPQSLAWNLAKLCSFLNNFTNSVIYGLLNAQFRHHFCRLLRMDRIRRRFQQRNTVYPFYLSERPPRPRV